MTTSITVTHPNDRAARAAVEAALQAGDRVVVLAAPPHGERRLAFTAYPTGRGFKLIGTGGSSTFEKPTIREVVDRGFANAATALRGGSK